LIVFLAERAMRCTARTPQLSPARHLGTASGAASAQQKSRAGLKPVTNSELNGTLKLYRMDKQTDPPKPGPKNGKSDAPTD